MSNNNVPRPVRLSDFVVIFAGLFHNLVSTFEAFTSELFELSIYHSNQRSKQDRLWEEFSQDLETLTEENDGA